MRTLLAAIGLMMVASAADARPWCSASRLNPTEQTICGSAYLRGLDERLQGVHNKAEALGQSDGAADWLRNQRDACGTASGCIESAYFTRISVLQSRVDALKPVLPASQPRPWCSASRLNLTERTICGSATLSDLDGLLQSVYDAANARGLAQGQSQWLRTERNGCGSDTLCVAGAYLDRIAVLEQRLK